MLKEDRVPCRVVGVGAWSKDDEDDSSMSDSSVVLIDESELRPKAEPRLRPRESPRWYSTGTWEGEGTTSFVERSTTVPLLPILELRSFDFEGPAFPF